MSNPYFQFKQFTVRHEHCAMKVGTDGVLLGAWAPLPDSGQGLDIGTGTGLLALMAAQRAPQMHFTGIDIDAEAARQAAENVQASPFAHRIRISHCPLQQFQGNTYQAILCNPPYFEESLLPPEARRTTARHTLQLSFAELAAAAARLLAPDGIFSVILPATAFATFHDLCLDNGLHLLRRCDVHTTPHKPAKRILAAYTHTLQPAATEQLILQDGNSRSEAYSRLCSDFYLH